MATAKLKRRSDGSPYYLIQVSMGRGRSPMSMRWDVPEGLSAKTVQSRLEKAKAEFEAKCKSGEIISRNERKALEAQAAAEAAKIQTLEQFANGVFLPQKEISVARNTYLFYKNAVNNHILPCLGAFKVPEISSAMISKVLNDAQGNPDLSSRTVTAIFQTNGIEHLHAHRLRHSFATLGIINGADVVSVAALLGHADASTTLRIYAHADEESKLRAAQTFREAVYGTAK